MCVIIVAIVIINKISAVLEHLKLSYRDNSHKLTPKATNQLESAFKCKYQT